jgi:hypothetical protein
MVKVQMAVTEALKEVCRSASSKATMAGRGYDSRSGLLWRQSTVEVFVIQSEHLQHFCGNFWVLSHILPSFHSSASVEAPFGHAVRCMALVQNILLAEEWWHIELCLP